MIKSNDVLHARLAEQTHRGVVSFGYQTTWRRFLANSQIYVLDRLLEGKDQLQCTQIGSLDHVSSDASRETEPFSLEMCRDTSSADQVLCPPLYCCHIQQRVLFTL